MRQDPIVDPPAIVSEAEVIDLDILMSEAKMFGRQTEEAAVACGQALIRVRAGCKHGEFIKLLAKHGFSRSTARRLMGMARGKCAKLAHLTGEVPISEPDESEPDEPAPGIQPNTIYCRPCRVSGKPKPNCKACKVTRERKLSLFAPAEPTTPPSPPTPLPGDAAEETAPDALLDAEGLPLPPSAKAALEDDSVDRWCEHIRKAFDGLDGLVTKPSGVFVNVPVLKKKLSAVARMAKAQKPTPGAIYRCPTCGGGGCTNCHGGGWLPRTIWSAL